MISATVAKMVPSRTFPKMCLVKLGGSSLAPFQAPARFLTSFLVTCLKECVYILHVSHVYLAYSKAVDDGTLIIWYGRKCIIQSHNW